MKKWKYKKSVDKKNKICIINSEIPLAKGGEKSMSTVKVGENESLDSALKRSKRKCQKDGIIGDLRKKEAYEKPSVARKKKSENARKKKYK